MRKPRMPAAPKPQRTCRVCGCTDDHACTPPCVWVDPSLCSGCASAAAALSRYFYGAVNPDPMNLLTEAKIPGGWWPAMVVSATKKRK